MSNSVELYVAKDVLAFVKGPIAVLLYRDNGEMEVGPGERFKLLIGVHIVLFGVKSVCRLPSRLLLTVLCGLIVFCVRSYEGPSYYYDILSLMMLIALNALLALTLNLCWGLAPDSCQFGVP